MLDRESLGLKPDASRLGAGNAILSDKWSRFPRPHSITAKTKLASNPKTLISGPNIVVLLMPRVPTLVPKPKNTYAVPFHNPWLRLATIIDPEIARISLMIPALIRKTGICHASGLKSVSGVAAEICQSANAIMAVSTFLIVIVTEEGQYGEMPHVTDRIQLSLAKSETVKPMFE
jgi:hypothetical protein